MPRPTLRGLGLLLLALAAYLGGRLVGTYELYLAALALLLLLVVSACLILLSGTKLGLRRSLQPSQPTAGDRVTDVVRLQSFSRLPTVAFRVVEPLTDVAGEDLSIDFGPLPPRGGRTRMEPLPPVRRGVFRLLPARVTLVDPLGLLTWSRSVGQPTSLVVLPAITSLRSCVFFGARDPGDGRRLRNPLGHGSYEFRGVRPHQPGEPLNRIHWKSTARMGSLMLRESDDTAVTGVAVVVDGHEGSRVGLPPADTFEAAVSAAGSIGDYLLREGFALELHLHQAEARTFRFSGTSPERRGLLEALAGAEADAPGTLRDYLLRSRERLARGLALVVVSAALDRSLALTLRRLREKGLPVYLVHVDGPSFLPTMDAAGRPASGQDAGLVQAVERTLLLNLQAAGIPSVTVRHGDDLDKVLSFGGSPPAGERETAGVRGEALP
jgi:uncharacterized protein (DUF58 family)